MGSGVSGLYCYATPVCTVLLPNLGKDWLSSQADSVSSDDKQPLAEEKHIAMMRENGVKFNEANVVMTAIDKAGNLVWLETGNKSAGLKHIIGDGESRGHEKDFENAFNVAKDEIPAFIKSVVIDKQLISEKRSNLSENRERIDRSYFVDDAYQLLVGVGTNGFIVSAFPKSNHGGAK